MIEIDAEFRLDGALKSRRWVRRSAPFPHVLAQEVFAGEVYAELEAAFKTLLAAPLQAHFNIGPFRHKSAYDVCSVGFTPRTTGPLSLFISRSWHDVLAAVLGMTATGDINGGLHHHRVGSASGRVHNDLNPGWFPRADDGAGINVSDERCDYHHGATKEPDLAVQERVRAAAMLFYINNPHWRAGDGGETGLYLSASDSEPAASIPPINNTLLLFECTPYSYHRFLANRRNERNSIILWLHRAKEEAVSRWGNKIVYWPKG